MCPKRSTKPTLYGAEYSNISVKPHHNHDMPGGCWRLSEVNHNHGRGYIVWAYECLYIIVSQFSHLSQLNTSHQSCVRCVWSYVGCYLLPVVLSVSSTNLTVSARAVVDVVDIECGDRQTCDGRTEYCDRLTDECVPCWPPCSRTTGPRVKLCVKNVVQVS